MDTKLLRLSSDITPIRQTSEKIMLPHIVAAAAAVEGAVESLVLENNSSVIDEAEVEE